MDKESLLVVAGIDVPAGDTFSVVTADVTSMGMEHVDAFTGLNVPPFGPLKVGFSKVSLRKPFAK